MSDKFSDDGSQNISLEMLRTAINAYTEEIQPCAAPDKRYMAAMIRNALEIVVRDFEAGRFDPYQSLIDLIGDNQISTKTELAAALRTSKISLDTHPELLKALINASRNELNISNPHALKSDAP